MAQVRAPELKAAWAVRLPAAEASSLGLVRLAGAVEVCESGGEIWLRGPALDDSLEQLLRRLPGARRYWLGPEGLVPAGGRLPSGKLPDKKWTRLSSWLVLKLQRVAAPGQPERQACFELVRSGSEAEPRVLVTGAETWAGWAETAPGARLAPLVFAASEDGEQALVWGHPLPPIAGARFVELEGVAVPCGFAWSPAVEPAVLRGLLGLAPGDLGVLHEDGSCDVVRVEWLAAATRSAVRQTFRRRAGSR